MNDYWCKVYGRRTHLCLEEKCRYKNGCAFYKEAILNNTRPLDHQPLLYNHKPEDP